MTEFGFFLFAILPYMLLVVFAINLLRYLSQISRAQNRISEQLERLNTTLAANGRQDDL